MTTHLIEAPRVGQGARVGDNLLLQAALEYSGHGLKVVPNHSVNPEGQCSCRDPECQKPGAKKRGKHPRIKSWQDNASDDESTICDWWSKLSMANVGVQLGPKSGIIDVEFDNEEGRAAADKYLGSIVTPSYFQRAQYSPALPLRCRA